MFAIVSEHLIVSLKVEEVYLKKKISLNRHVSEPRKSFLSA